MWKSLSAIVRSVKRLTVSYTAAGLLPVTTRALGTRSSIYCCHKDGVRPDFQSPYTLSWHGAKTEEKQYLYLSSFPNLGFGLESPRRKVCSVILCCNVHRKVEGSSLITIPPFVGFIACTSPSFFHSRCSPTFP
jgi:hypothetical protein